MFHVTCEADSLFESAADKLHGYRSTAVIAMALASESKEVIVLKTQKKDFSYIIKSLFAGGNVVHIMNVYYHIEDWTTSFFLKMLIDFIIGVAGMCSKTAVAPLDRLKILLQAHNKHYTNFGNNFFTHIDVQHNWIVV